MKKSLFFFILICCACFAKSQSDTAQLLKQIDVKLRGNPSAVSSVLSDKSYVALHPLISFREMIKTNAAAAILNIAPADEPGKKIRVIATIINREGQPIPNALVYLYQTDSRGWYAADAPHVLRNEGDFRHARLFGYVRSDKDGKIELHTIKPAGYPQSDLPAHIHVHVSADGYRAYGTEFLFKDDERLKGEILNRAVIDGGMIALPEKTQAPFEQQFSYTMKLIKQ